MISEETKGIIARLLLEKLPLAGIARALQISQIWVQQYVNQKYKQVEREVQVRPKSNRRLTVQMDELPSFVSNQGNKQWVWLVLDAETHEIVGVHIGDRSSASAQALWQSMPAVRSPMCRDRSVIAGQPMSRSYPASGITQSVKKLGKRATQSRFNCTLRQRVSQLVRKTLSFSKKLDDRIGAIWNFYHRYNASLPPTTSFPL